MVRCQGKVTTYVTKIFKKICFLSFLCLAYCRSYSIIFHLLKSVDIDAKPTMINRYFQKLRTLITIPYAELTENLERFPDIIDSVSFIVEEQAFIQYAIMCEGKGHN